MMKRLILMFLIVGQWACSGCEEESMVQPPGPPSKPVVCQAMGFACSPAQTTEAVHNQSLDLVEDAQTLWEQTRDMDQVLAMIEPKVVYAQKFDDGHGVAFALKGGLLYSFTVYDKPIVLPTDGMTQSQALASATYKSTKPMAKQALVLAPTLFQFGEDHLEDHMDVLAKYVREAEDYAQPVVVVEKASPQPVNKAYVRRMVEGFEYWNRYSFVTVLTHGRQSKLPNSVQIAGKGFEHITLFDAAYVGHHNYQTKKSPASRHCSWEVLQWIKDKPGVGCGLSAYVTSYDGQEKIQHTMTHVLSTTDHLVAYNSAPLNNQHVTFLNCQSGKYGPAVPLGDNASAVGFSDTVGVDSVFPVYRLHQYMWDWGMDVGVAMHYTAKHEAMPTDWCGLDGLVNGKPGEVCLKSFVSGVPRGPKEHVVVYQSDTDQTLAQNGALQMQYSSSAPYPYGISLKLDVYGVNVPSAKGDVVYCGLGAPDELDVLANFEGLNTGGYQFVDKVIMHEEGRAYVALDVLFENPVERTTKTQLTLSITEPKASGLSCRGYRSTVTYDVTIKPPVPCGTWSATVGGRSQQGNHAYIMNEGVSSITIEDVSVFTEDDYQTEGMQFTGFFVEGFGGGKPVQLTGSDGTRTWTSASETSVRFEGVQLPDGRWKGVLRGKVNEVIMGSAEVNEVDLFIEVTSAATDDFNEACL